MSETIPFAGKRIVHRSERSFDEVIASLNARLASGTTFAELVAHPGDKDAYEANVKKWLGKCDFFSVAKMDYGGWVARYGVKNRIVRWMIGNPLIAISMVEADPIASLFVPVEILITEEDTGANVTYVLPSSLIAIDEKSATRAQANYLDAKLAAFVALATEKDLQ